MGLESLGRLLVVLGIAIAVVGVLLILGSRLPLLGRLPGDIAIERDNVRIYIPVATMLLLSVVLSVVLTLLANLLSRR